MKKFLDKDELYPYYYFMLGEEGNIEITEDEFKEYNEIMEKFDLLQEKLKKLYERKS